MFDSQFSNKGYFQSSQPQSFYSAKHIRKVSLLNWEEHCLECAVPLCYTTCSLYKEREDKRCIRINNGLQRDYSFDGLYGYGVLCSFNKWGKIETVYSHRMVDLDLLNRFVFWNDFSVKLFTKMSRLIRAIDSKYMMLRGLVHLKNIILKNLSANVFPEYFLLECYLHEKDKEQLLLQTYDDNKVLWSKIIQINEGRNVEKIRFDEMNLKDSVNSRIIVAPLSDDITRLTFTWLDFVQFKTNKSVTASNAVPASKVKCVAWDLDNTLWKGVFIEDGKENLTLNSDAIELIRRFDERGILNTIVSKNSFDEVFNFLKELGIEKYFLYPAINWGQKSINLVDIAGSLNIGLDTFALIDDNERERFEVKTALPMVRVYSDKEINALLSLEEFDVPITDMSRMRRQSYVIEEKRKLSKTKFNSDYESYLRDLELRLEVKHVGDKKLKERCYELLSRSNQLNLSTNRYDWESYEYLLSTNTCFAFRCYDKFGDYGTIGFISINMNGENVEILDLVISCRVAQKKVEDAMICAVIQYSENMGCTTLRASLKHTKKNKPIANVLDSLPFTIIQKGKDSTLYEISDFSLIENKEIVRIDYLF